MRFIKNPEFPGLFNRGFQIHFNRGKFTNTGGNDQPAICIAEGKLAILIIIGIHHKRLEIVLLDKGPETDVAVVLLMLVEMLK